MPRKYFLKSRMCIILYVHFMCNYVLFDSDV